MKTVVKKIDSHTIDKKVIEEAASLIRSGELVAFPTETVYGLGADALLPEGAKKIYTAKGRPSDNPLIIHIADFDALEKITAYIPPQAKALAAHFWPGPLTMIFQKSACVPYETTGGMDTVAVRMPSHPVALELIRESGGYIAAPSANTSGRPSPTLAAHVYHDLQGRIPMILDGGPVGIGLESTIIDLSGISPRMDASVIQTEGTIRESGVPMVLRPGYITREMLSELIGEVRDDPGLIAADSKVKPKAPGMKYKHYAPKANLVLVEGKSEKVVAEINRLVQQCYDQGKKAGVIGTDETVSCYTKGIVKSIGSRKDEASIARHLYGILREFDELDVDCIYSESFATPHMGQAIMNRLLKAAGHQVIHL